ncbi:MAG: alpha/beta fold hydrolase [Hyphomonadaceae bacterium]
MSPWLIAALAAAIAALLLFWLFHNGRVYARRVEAVWPAEGRFIETHGASIHVLEAGPSDAPPVLLIHGASANLRELWAPLASDLARDHRVIALDRPGYGHSTRPKRGAERLATQAAVVAGILRATETGAAVVIGHSLGAAIALRLALDAPNTVAGLVLVAPASHPYPGKPAWWARFAATPLLGAFFSGAIIPLLGPIAGRGGIANNFAPGPVPPGYAEDAGVGLIFRASAFRASARDVCATKVELAAQAPRYAELLTPAIVITAERDRVVSPKRHARALAAELPAAELVIAPNAGHMPHRVRPDLVLAAVRRVGAMAGVYA